MHCKRNIICSYCRTHTVDCTMASVEFNPVHDADAGAITSSMANTAGWSSRNACCLT